MGASPKTFNRLVDLKRAGRINVGSRMLELGAQDISHATGPNLHSFIAEFRDEPCTIESAELAKIAAGGTMATLMKLCGVDYLALDIFESEDCMLFDLNTDTVPDQLRCQFDLVTNFGTSEHVFDQYRTFMAIHDFTKPGGIMYHDLPMGGYLYHGYFSYTPLFFHYLALANGYEILFKYFWKQPILSPFSTASSPELMENGWPDHGYHDAGIEFIFRKTTDAPFRTPVEGDSSRDIDHAFVEDRHGNSFVVNKERG